MFQPRALPICILLASLAFPLSAATSLEQTARDYLTLAYAGRFDQLPHVDKAAGLERFEGRLKGTFRTRCVEVDGIRVTRVDESAGSVEVEVALTKREREGPWVTAEVIPLRLRGTREGANWIIAAVEYPEDEIADRLIAAASDDEREALLRANEEWITGGVARALYGKAMRLLNSAETAKAPRVAEIGQDVARRAGDRGAETLAFGAHVIFARIQRDFKKGLRLGREAIAMAEETGDPDVLVTAWQNISRIIAMEANERGDRSDKALAEHEDSLRRALMYARRAEEAALLVRVLENLALHNAAKNDFFTARAHQEELLPIAREIGDIGGQIGYEIQVANIYFSQGDRELAMYHHRRAMELTERHDPRRHPYTLIRYGGVLMTEKRYDEASAVFAKALPRDEKGAFKPVMNSISANMIAFVMQSLANIAAEDGQLDEALCWVNESHAIRTKGDQQHASFILAPYFIKRGDHATALKLALPSIAGKLKPDAAVRAMRLAAQAYRGLGQPEQALSILREAIDLLEEQTERLAGGDDQQILNADQIGKTFKLAAEIALGGGEVGDALAFLESGRARVLGEVIEHGRPGAQQTAEQSEERSRVAQEQKVARLSVELNRATAAGDAKATATLEQQLREARQQYRSVTDGMEARSERRRATKRRIDRAELPRLLGRLPQGLTAVEYFVAAEHLHIFVARADGTVAHRSVSVSEKALGEKVARFVKAISENDLRVREPAAELHELLIAPVESELRAAEALLIVPDDVLWRVSFAALADAGGRHLVERWPLVYAPSIAVFTAMDSDRGGRTETLLAVGNPYMDAAESGRFRSYYRAGLGALPHAELEVDAVRRLYGSHNTRVLKRRDATESRTRSEMTRADVIHFATHGLIDDRNPMYSRLALARGGEATEDGWLETWEIARLTLDADLVVLSACDTARGTIGDGEGVIGLTWAFFVAGARSTLATQWKVESEHTAQFMIHFHERLRTGGAQMKKARALQRAQLRSIRDRRYRHPFYWAAFVLFGSAS